MDKRLTIWSVAGFVMLYFVTVFAAEFVGFLHPVCWVLAPALGASPAVVIMLAEAGLWISKRIIK